MGDTILKLIDIKKSFGTTEVLDGINIEIEKGEFITLLGPSGCGKTTTLRIIAGLETMDSGQVILNGEDISHKEPNKRDVNTVFQNYALFPHMNVEENIGYGLKIKKVHKNIIKEKVKEALELVQLSGYEKRKPSELSGGQKQRIAIARAIVNNPQLLLLDEPLGALDLQLRRQMQLELKRLQKKLGITFIYITHDQEEAINMSTRIVVMKDGLFQQIGTPDEVYNNPRTSYVATFVGNANIVKGTVTKVFENQTAQIRIGTEYILVDLKEEQVKENESITLAVRSENILLFDDEKAVHDELAKENSINYLSAEIVEKSFAGGLLRMVLKISDGTEIVASRHGIDYHLEAGEKIYLGWERKNAVMVDRNFEKGMVPDEGKTQK